LKPPKLLRTITDDTTYQKIGRYLSDECNPEEALALETIIRDEPEVMAIFSDLQKLWETKPRHRLSLNAENSLHELEALISMRIRVFR
jgi:hypothetical protein